MSILTRLAEEPPFRLVSLAFIKRFAKYPATRARWSAGPYPQYLTGLVEAAEVAKIDRVATITAIEFGVASGRGLLALQRHAQSVESVTGVNIKVVGFDAGSGLPELTLDHRDHPDYWRAGDFPMDVARLTAQLEPGRTELKLGDVRSTVPEFMRTDHAPVGFVSFDLDLYSGTVAALPILRTGRMLRRTPLYFDDVYQSLNHKWAGERLAITEFNDTSESVKIDQWHGVRHNKVFPESHVWDGMYIAHDLHSISRYSMQRPVRHL